MGILDSIMKEAGGALLGQVAKSIGIDKSTAEAAFKSLTPALSRGLQQNMRKQGGADSVMDALLQGNHDRTLNDFSSLNLDETVNEGNSILGHILGSKDVSRNVAGAAAKESGLSAGMLKKMLPIVAMVVMGMMKRKTRASGFSKKTGGGLLSSFLDTDGDGSIIDDVLSMAIKFF